MVLVRTSYIVRKWPLILYCNDMLPLAYCRHKICSLLLTDLLTKAIWSLHPSICTETDTQVSLILRLQSCCMCTTCSMHLVSITMVTCCAANIRIYTKLQTVLLYWMLLLKGSKPGLAETNCRTTNPTLRKSQNCAPFIAPKKLVAKGSAGTFALCATRLKSAQGSPQENVNAMQGQMVGSLVSWQAVTRGDNDDANTPESKFCVNSNAYAIICLCDRWAQVHAIVVAHGSKLIEKLLDGMQRPALVIDPLCLHLFTDCGDQDMIKTFAKTGASHCNTPVILTDSSHHLQHTAGHATSMFSVRPHTCVSFECNIQTSATMCRVFAVLAARARPDDAFHPVGLRQRGDFDCLSYCLKPAPGLRCSPAACWDIFENNRREVSRNATGWPLGPGRRYGTFWQPGAGIPNQRHGFTFRPDPTAEVLFAGYSRWLLSQSYTYGTFLLCYWICQ